MSVHHPTSFAQERLWFVEQLEPGAAVNNIPLVLHLDGPLDVDALRRALDALVERHESLRTSFAEVDGAPVQVVAEPAPVALPVHEVPAAAVEEWAASEAARPFDLAVPPLMRTVLLGLAPDDHVLLLTTHHIVSDGWSLQVLTRELGALYEAFASGRPAGLPPLPMRYADFARLQREDAGAMDEQLAYWRSRLAGAPPLLALPADRPRPATAAHRSGRVSRRIGPALAGSLRAIARREGATLFMALLAAFDVLLARWSGQRDVVVGTRIANRNRLDVEALIGFFVNTLALRSDLSDDPTLAGLLRRVRDTTLDAYDHQDVPFERLVAELRPARDPHRAPLFQALFVLHQGGVPFDRGGVRWTPRTAPVELVPVDVYLSVVDTGGELVVNLNYDRDLFEEATADRMVGHYERVLEQLVSEPERRVSEVRLLGEAERRQVVEGWNRTATVYEDQGWLPELVSAQAGRTPEAVAVESEGGCLTYRELEQRSNRVARALRGRGVGPESVVGLRLERSPEQVVALLGILKAGAAYLPLEGVAEERRAYLQADSGVSLVLETLPEDASAEPVQSLVGGENAAYVLYTSGSTGEPKGVAVSHRALRNRMLGMQAEHRLQPTDGVLVKTSLGFDVSVWEVFWPLLAGARLVLARPGGQADSGYLAELIRQRQVTTAHFVPGMLRAFVEEPASAECSSLLRVLCGGESLADDLRDRFCMRLPHCQLHHLYGPTEATIDVTSARCSHGQGPGPVPIGRPLANTRLYVLDQALEPAPIGVVGELYIGGVQLARGYLGRPGQTAERFLPDPFLPGQRLYRSGDLARWRSDGSLEYAGRTDEQVKVRGVRVEPGEVERVLERHPAVRQAAVVSRPDGSGQRMLAGFVTATAAGVSEEELREHLRRRLPEQSVPAWLAVLEELPRLPSGKVDRRALAGLEVAPLAARPAHQAPRDQLETTLAAIWSEVLGRQDVGVHDDFFGLGGHSLLATRAVARVRDALALQVPLRLLFDEPTVAGFANALATAPREEAPLLPATRRADWEDDLRARLERLPDDELEAVLRGAGAAREVTE